MIWSEKPWSYIPESLALAEAFEKFVDWAESTKLIAHDPFENVVSVSCPSCQSTENMSSFVSTQKSGRVRQKIIKKEVPFKEIHWNYMKQASKFPLENALLLLREFLSSSFHPCFLEQIGVANLSPGFWSIKIGSISGGRHNLTTDICQSCRHMSPFPCSLSWKHNCQTREWALGKNNNLIRWNASASCWIANITYHNILWQDIRSMPKAHVSRDAAHGVFLISDSFIKDFVRQVNRWINPVSFDDQSKAKAEAQARQQQQKQSGKPASVAKLAAAAQAILLALPPDLLKKFYRTAILELHPDKGGDTKVFQTFQENWNIFERERPS